jgi:16S rRNA (adenine1518-N6/adenine1519-N6)-dimethyltransferase
MSAGEDPLPETARAAAPLSGAAIAALRADLEASGFRPSKRLGQNLLQDVNMARAIARDAQVAAGDLVVEIGPGAGFLSVHLAELGVDLVAIEIDPRLLEFARGLLAEYPRVRWICGDALASKRAWNPELLATLPAQGDWHLVSNLPYSAASPILVTAARLDNPPRSITVLLQTEVAKRIAAAPGGGDWGPLSIRVQLAYSARVLRAVPPQLFWPRPKVESSVLRLELREQHPDREDTAQLDVLVDRLFQHRRQAIGGLLSRSLGNRETAESLLSRHRLSAKLRPEVLPLEALLALSRDPAWRARSGAEAAGGEEISEN